MAEENKEDVVDQLLSSVLGGNESVTESIAREQALVRVRVERRKRHLVTVIEVDSSDVKNININEIAKDLKRKLAAGGTVKGNAIEIQGDHRYRVKKMLVDMGFKEENILVSEEIVEGE